MIKKNIKFETEHLRRAITLVDRLISLVQVERLVYEVNNENENNPYENIYQDIVALLDKLLQRYKALMFDMNTQSIEDIEEYYGGMMFDSVE